MASLKQVSKSKRGIRDKRKLEKRQKKIVKRAQKEKRSGKYLDIA